MLKHTPKIIYFLKQKKPLESFIGNGKGGERVVPGKFQRLLVFFRRMATINKGVYLFHESDFSHEWRSFLDDHLVGVKRVLINDYKDKKETSKYLESINWNIRR